MQQSRDLLPPGGLRAGPFPSPTGSPSPAHPSPSALWPRALGSWGPWTPSLPALVRGQGCQTPKQGQQPPRGVAPGSLQAAGVCSAPPVYRGERAPGPHPGGGHRVGGRSPEAGLAWATCGNPPGGITGESWESQEWAVGVTLNQQGRDPVSNLPSPAPWVGTLLRCICHVSSDVPSGHNPRGLQRLHLHDTSLDWLIPPPALLHSSQLPYTHSREPPPVPR